MPLFICTFWYWIMYIIIWTKLVIQFELTMTNIKIKKISQVIKVGYYVFYVYSVIFKYKLTILYTVYTYTVYITIINKLSMI